MRKENDNFDRKPMITIILPMYKVSKLSIYSIKAVEKIMRTYGYRYEIIVVDDGSPDDTYNYALAASKNPSVRVYRLPRNMGKGFALLYGFKKSSGDIVVFFDGDLDIDPRQITLLIDTLISSNSDAVITSKWHPRSRIIATPTRRFLSKTFYILTKLFLKLEVSDTQTGAKVFRRKILEDAIKHLVVKRYAFDVELLVVITARGCRILEVPALWNIKLTSKFKLKEISRMFLDLLAITYRYRVKKWYPTSYKY